MKSRETFTSFITNFVANKSIVFDAILSFITSKKLEFKNGLPSILFKSSYMIMQSKSPYTSLSFKPL